MESEPRCTTACSLRSRCHPICHSSRRVSCSCLRQVSESVDRPLLNSEMISKVDLTLVTELDWQLFQLQRKYLDYQVNIGNRIIAVLQSGEPDAAQKAQALSEPKRMFQDIVDDLFRETGKTIIRTANEIKFNQIGEVLQPYQLSAGEKQMLAILLTVLVEDNQSYVLFMDEPEISLHFEWQKQLISLVLKLNPNIQIIMTTHSPAVVMDGWTDRVTAVNDITIKCCFSVYCFVLHWSASG